MDPVRWRRIEELYHAALARPEAERAALLAEACAGDEVLQQEVQALLDTPATTEGVFAAPALAMAAGVIGETAPAAGAEAPALRGRRLGVYHLQERIGAGGMGEVYRARDTRLGRDVAIKVLPAAFTADADRLARFEREARILAALNHPNIATIHGTEESEGLYALVMELVQGETLAERIHRGPLPRPEALVIARQLAEALEAAHNKAIVHRDLKPANVKITAEGLVKVLDFGLAKALAVDALSLELTEAPTLTVQGTRDGAILGTAPYMSPEQARGQPVDKRTDIWSFGCVLYELLTGTRAFRGRTLPDTLAAILDREPAWQQLPAKTPPDVRRLLRRCLEKDTAARYHSGAELLADVAACQAQLAAQTVALTAILKRPAIVAVAVSCVILVSTAGAWWWVRTARASWARDEAIPHIERLVVEDEYLAAYDLAQQAEAYLRDDGSLRALWPQFATTASLITAPDGADIFFRTYRSRDSDWRYLGRSPLNNVRLPRGTFRWRIAKTGFATLEVATGSLRGTAGPTASLYSSFFPPLTESTQLPRDMVFVP